MVKRIPSMHMRRYKPHQFAIMPSKMEVASQHCDTVPNKTKDILDTVKIEKIFYTSPAFVIYISSSASSSWPFNSWLQFMPQAGRLAVKCRHCYPFSSSHDTRSRSRGMEGYQKSLQYCGCTAESQLFYTMYSKMTKSTQC